MIARRGRTEAALSDTTLAFPVHQELIMRNGIFNSENMRFGIQADRVYEFVRSRRSARGRDRPPAWPIAIADRLRATKLRHPRLKSMM
jgi:hypothetical protein